MLREVLEKREQSWLKLTEKEHEHRTIVGKLKNELAHLRQAATFNREELEKKSLKYKVSVYIYDRITYITNLFLNFK